MPPKGKDKKAAQAAVAEAAPAVIERLFPKWDEAAVANEKETTETYSDPHGQLLPEVVEPFVDCWKRPAELVLNAPEVPLVELEQEMVDSGKGPQPVLGGATGRKVQGDLLAGHPAFEWLLAAFQYILRSQTVVEKGCFLWELIYPKDKGSSIPAASSSGRYIVKMWLMDGWRQVEVDDLIPVDLFGRSVLVSVRPVQLWPLLLCKAVLKVLAAYRIINQDAQQRVPVLHWLTGWVQENLRDRLHPLTVESGQLFDRIEDVTKAPSDRADRRSIVATTLRDFAQPDRPPPRLIVIGGPSGVGRHAVVARLLAQYSSKFGSTVSHTTRRPLEHERHGTDFYFVQRPEFQSLVDEEKMLQHELVQSRFGWHFYGSSLNTVREVAATGKVCLMSLEAQGVASLKANKRIDGLYLYIRPPSMAALEERQRARLKEAESTIQKRLEWARQEVEKAGEEGEGLFDHIIANEDEDNVLYELKEAISCLSPIIRNRLRGLPAYVLDYSDLIITNDVEKPFLKPIIIAGPSTGERQRLMRRLVEDFPDVFGFPKYHTTRPPDCDRLHRVSEEEVQQLRQQQEETAALAEAGSSLAPSPSKVSYGSRASSPLVTPQSHHSTLSGTRPSSKESARPPPPDGASPAAENAESTAAAAAPEAAQRPGTTGSVADSIGGRPGGEPPTVPEPEVLSKDTFDEWAKAGRFAEHHRELFVHELVQERHGVTPEELEEVRKTGRLALLDCESEGAQMMLDAGIDCLTIFLKPQSLQEYEQRLREWLKESDEDISAMQEQAEQEIAQAEQGEIWDHVLVNDTDDNCLESLEAIISRYRPDLIPPPEDGDLQPPAAQYQPPLFLHCPLGSAPADEVVVRLQAKLPEQIRVPTQHTSRKPEKGQSEGNPYFFLKPEVFQSMVNEQQFLQLDDTRSLGTTLQAVQDITATNSIAAVSVADLVTLQRIVQADTFPDALGVCLMPGVDALQKAASDASGEVDAEKLQQLDEQMRQAAERAQDLGMVLVAIDEEDADITVFDIRSEISRRFPAVVPPLPLPLVVCGPFGTGKRMLELKLLQAYPSQMDIPVIHRAQNSDHQGPASAAGVSVNSDEEGLIEDLDVDAMRQAAEKGSYLVQDEVMGSAYGIPTRAVKHIIASGKVCLVDVDHVAKVRELRDMGFEANFVFICPQTEEHIREVVGQDMERNPPLDYSAAEASEIMFSHCKEQIQQADSARELFDARVETLSCGDAAFSQVLECMSVLYPEVVKRCDVWGFGRPLWDHGERDYGRQPLKLLLLGPAAVGKTTAAHMLCEMYQVPHVNAGDLLSVEIRQGTPLGKRAQRYIDSYKLVPDDILLTVVHARLSEDDCQTQGWLLDGFPHTQKQADRMQAAGFRPDKVFFLESPHDLLFDRMQFRRIDPLTNSVYQVAPSSLPPGKHGGSRGVVQAHGKVVDPAAQPRSGELLPMRADGEVDTLVLARLEERHDDTDENFQNRLSLYDDYEEELKACFRLNSLRLNATQDTSVVVGEMKQFIELEYNLVDSITVHRSCELKKAHYDVVGTLKYEARPLLKLLQGDGKEFWVELDELAENSHHVLLHQDQAAFQHQQMAVRRSLEAVAQDSLLVVESPEPIRLLIGLQVGVQFPLDATPPPTCPVLALTGPSGAGKSTLINLLLQQFPQKLALVPTLTSSLPTMRSGDPAHFRFLDENQIGVLHERGQLLYRCSVQGDEYACLKEDVEAPFRDGKLPILRLDPPAVHCFREQGGTIGASALIVSVQPPDVEALDVRLRERGQGLLPEQRIQEFILDACDRNSSLSLPSSISHAAKEPDNAEVGADGNAEAATAGEASQEGAEVESSVPPSAKDESGEAASETAGPQHTLTNDRLHRCYCDLRDIVSGHWPRALQPNSCRMNVESFDWAVPTTERGWRRLMTVTAGAGRVDLPRGRHVLALRADQHLSHAVSCWSNDAFTLDQLPKVLQDHEGLHENVVEGLYAEAPEGGWKVWMRQVFEVAEPTRVWIDFKVDKPAVRQSVKPLVLINNDDGAETLLVLHRSLEPRLFLPNSSGYTLLAVCQSAQGKPQPSGEFKLTLVSDLPLKSFTALDASRMQKVAGEYAANHRTILDRRVLSPVTDTAATFYAQVSAVRRAAADAPEGAAQKLRAGFCVTLRAPMPQAEPSVEKETVMFRSRGQDALTQHELRVPAGRHVLQMELDRALCEFDIEEDGMVEEGVDIHWSCMLAPSSDEKACPIAADDTLKKAVRGLLASWNEKGRGGLKDRPKLADAAWKGWTAAQASESGPAMDAVRQGKDSSMELDPEAHTQHKEPAVQEETQRLTAESYEQRKKVVEAAAAEAQQQMSSWATKWSQDQDMAALKQDHVEALQSWRQQLQHKLQDIITRHHEAALAKPQAQPSAED